MCKLANPTCVPIKLMIGAAVMSQDHHTDYSRPNHLQTTEKTRCDLSYFSTKNSQFGML
jgi:hypothetical protein